jgi:hypothetical protein
MNDFIFPTFSGFTSYGGTIKKIGRFAYEDRKDWSLFNPCIAVNSEGKYAATFRSSNYHLQYPQYDVSVLNNEGGGMVSSRVWFGYLDDNLDQISDMRIVEFTGFKFKIKRGLEDARLYWRDGSWWITAVLFEPGNFNHSKLCLFKYDDQANLAHLVELYENRQVFASIEKNWMAPYKANPNFDYIYDCGKTVKNCQVTKVQDNADDWAFRGGSCLWDLGDKTYLAIVHRQYQAPYTYYRPASFATFHGSVRNYTHFFVKYDYTGKIIGFSDEFQFLGPGVEFAAGLIEKGNDFIISLGRGDASSHIATIKRETVLNMIKEV